MTAQIGRVRYVRDILRRLCPTATDRSVYAMFKGYMDETGITGEPVCAVGGFVGSEDVCDDAADKWIDALNEFQVSEFHARQFWERTQGRAKGIYSHLHKCELHDFLLRLIDSVSSLTPVAIAIGVEQYDALTEDERRWLTTNASVTNNWSAEGMPSAPYFLCFQACVIRSTKLVPEAEKIFYTFDRQEAYREKAVELYNQILELPLDRISRLGETVAFSGKREAVLLQAADLLVFVLRWFAESSMAEVDDELARRIVQQFILEKDYVTAGRRDFLDVVLRSCPFRSSFWQGMTEPDLIEDLRSQNVKVFPAKGADGVYQSHFLSRNNVRIIQSGRLQLPRKK
jgi:hypothetical protein